MNNRTNRPGKTRKRLRRAMVVFLAAAYVLVGFAGEISCAEETLEIPHSTAAASATSDRADVDSKKTPTVVDHCYSCAPVVIPAAAVIYAPASLSGAMCFGRSTIPALEARLLDTPPPKSSI